MNLCDVNVWLALSLSGHRHHKTAVAWFDSLSQPKSVAFCRATQQGFLRLLTSAAIWQPIGRAPMNNRTALGLYDQLLGDDRVHFVGESIGTESSWRHFAALDTASPKVWMDAYLAAIAKTQSLTLITLDNGFRKFESLDWRHLGN